MRHQFMCYIGMIKHWMGQIERRNTRNNYFESVSKYIKSTIITAAKSDPLCIAVADGGNVTVKVPASRRSRPQPAKTAKIEATTTTCTMIKVNTNILSYL